MSDWKLILPEATRNMVLNPSAEIAGNFAALGGPVSATRIQVNAKYGSWAYYLSTNGNDQGIRLTLSQLSNDVHYVTLRATEFLSVGAEWDWSLDGVNYHTPTVLLTYNTGGDTWYGTQFPAIEAWNSVSLDIRQNGAGTIEMWFDGVQVEEKSYWTTYCGGDQEGCQWDGIPHASTSRRTSVARAGGIVRDFQDDYNFNIEAMLGPGSVPHNLRIDPYALLPGGELNSAKLPSRSFTLTGTIDEDDWITSHKTRAALLAVLTPSAYPEDERGPQELRIWYTGADVVKEISASFERGLDLRLSAKRDPCLFERNIGLQFKAADPLWYEIGNSSHVLDENDSAVLRYMAGRPYSVGNHGIWDDMSVGAATNPVAVYAMVVGPDGRVYVGGDFDLIDGIPNTLNVAVYDPLADTWAALGNGLDNAATGGGVVYGLAFAPDGDLYAVGIFDSTGGVGADDCVARWNGAAWNAVGTPTAGAAVVTNVNCVTVDQSGNIFIGGDFTTFANTANASYTAYWDGAAWNALQALVLSWSGGTPEVFAMDLAPNGDIYIGGNFTRHTVNNDVNYILRYDGTAYNMLGVAAGTTDNGVNNTVYAIAVDRSGQVFLGGAFTSGMNETVTRIAKWNGTAFEALGNGLDATVHTFTMTDLSWVDRLARWKDNSWAPVDINLPGAPTVYTIAIGAADPVLAANYDVWVGFNTTGAAYFSGSQTITHSWATGGWLSYPKLLIERSGGTSAHVLSIKNTSNGYELNVDYALQDGERLTVDLMPTRKSIVSSFYGEVPAAVLPNSDFGAFALLSRTNADGDLNVFADLVGAPTMTTWLEYRKSYESVD
jgi:hypothetical protein